MALSRWRDLIASSVVLAAVAATTTDRAAAANGAYAVDAADISDLGSCKVESWLSMAGNSDLVAVANPSCVVNIMQPVELSVQSSRSRSDGVWDTSFAPKAKINIEPTGIGKFGFSTSVSGAVDALTGQNTAINVNIPVTYRFSETMRVNLNGGWLWDRAADRHYMTYGAGFDWKWTDTLQYTIEVYGQAGRSGLADESSILQPRVQTGVRYRPNEIFSVDLIYGHNITGENSNWITLGTTVRFPASSGKTDSHW